MIRTLRADHDWRRREFSLNLNSKWLEMKGKSAIEIEKEFPHIRYTGMNNEKHELSREKAIEVYNEVNDRPTYELRNHIINLLNFMDFIAQAYFNGVADRQILDSSMKFSILSWYKSLEHFVEVVQEQENTRYWGKLQDLILIWQSKKAEVRKITA